MKHEYSRALSAAEDELAALLRQKRLIDARLLRLKATIESLSGLRPAGKTGISLAAAAQFDPRTGLTEAIRTVLRDAAPSPLKAPAIRDALAAGGFHLDRYASPLTVIHNTVKRMIAQGEIETSQNRFGVFDGWATK